MMSPIRLDDDWISSIVETTCETTSPPLRAIDVAELASWFAVRAESAVWRTLLLSCSIELAACCRLLAVCSVRWLKSRLPVAISALAVEMLSVAWRIPPMVRDSFACMTASACSKRPTSSAESTRNSAVRSPAATRCAEASAALSGRVMLRVISQANRPPATSSSVPSVGSSTRLLACVAATLAAAVSMDSRWCLSICSTMSV